MNHKCAQCGFDNDPTRIFCQNCGARLEIAAPESGKLFIPTGQQAPAGVRKPIKPVSVGSNRSGRSIGGSLLGFLISTLFCAAILAAGIQMVRTPNNVPPPIVGDETQAGQVYSSIDATAQSTYPRNLGISEPQINNYLAAKLLPAESSGGSFFQRKFVRAFVTLGTGSYRFTAEQQISGLPIYIYLNQKPLLAGNTVTVVNISGGIGRLPFHPALTPLLTRLMGPIMEPLSDVQPLFANATSVDVQPSLVIVNWPGTARKP